MDDDQLQIGIGLNSGSVVAGSIGGAGRLEFSVIGDAVNVAARVESATRETGDLILLSERTRELLQGDHGLLERAGDRAQGQERRRDAVRATALSVVATLEAGWRAVKPELERASECQRGPAPPEVSQRRPATTM